MSADPLFGWDLTFKTIERDLNKKSDILVSFAHFLLVKRGFRSVGLGDDRTVAGSEAASELLPSGWNDGEQYSLRYTLDNKLYILKAVASDGNLTVNLMKAEDLAVSSLAFNIEDTVKEMSGSLDNLMPEYEDIMYKVKRDIVDAVCATPQSEQRSSLLEERRPQSGMMPPRGGPVGWPEASPLQIGRSDLDPFSAGGGMIFDPFTNRPGPINPGLGIPGGLPRPEASPLQIGRSDLDPFSAGGGMIFDPFTNRPGPIKPGLGIPGGLPRGSVPPGARFDPFSPPDYMAYVPRRQPPPDSDDFMPPGNMFM